MSKTDSFLGFEIGPSLPERITLPEFIGTFSHLVPLFFRACDENLGESEYDAGLWVKISGDDLYLTSLHPDLTVETNYHQVIPDNGHGLICDLALVTSGKNKIDLKVVSTTIETDFLTFHFKISNSKKINFPEDYFLKGYPIFTALLQASILGIKNSVVAGKNHNSARSKENLIKKLSTKHSHL